MAAELERRGIPTVAVILLPMIAKKVRPPRAVCVPYPHGYPLGRPQDPELQHRVLEAALEVWERKDQAGPVLIEEPAALQLGRSGD